MRTKRLITPAFVLASVLVLIGGAPVGSAPAVESPAHENASSAVVTSPTSEMTTNPTAASRESVSATAQRNRRVTGNGNTKKFYKGESVAGEVITLRSGLTFYRCYMANAPQSGKVTSGVINPFRAERKNLPNCSDTQSSPGRRNPTGNGNWGQFQSGDYVLGFAIEVNLGSNGRTYFSCLMKPAQASGRVNSGVVNPSRFEMSGFTACNDTSNWNPGFRTASGDGNTIRFNAGDRILGAYIRYDNGIERFNCFDRVADMDGSLISGVRNYWPGEDNQVPAC